MHLHVLFFRTHLALIYPYLIPLLDEYVFTPFSTDVTIIKDLAEKILKTALQTRQYEAASYALYFAIKYNFQVNILANQIIQEKDCILLTMAYLYFLDIGNKCEIDALKQHARSLSETDFDSNWIFAYEILPKAHLKGNWKKLKEASVTFIRPIIKANNIP